MLEGSSNSMVNNVQQQNGWGCTALSPEQGLFDCICVLLMVHQLHETFMTMASGEAAGVVT